MLHLNGTICAELSSPFFFTVLLIVSLRLRPPPSKMMILSEVNFITTPYKEHL